jgi:glycosyltransferase involved in cell wall biosynthesis
LDGIYVESSTFLPAEMDLAFLGLARSLGIPVLTYIRDAYQLFDDYYAADSPKRWLGARLFLPAIRALRAVSTRLAFPSAGLSEVLGSPSDQTVLLPPGAPPPVEVPRRSGANRLLFVGSATWPAQGMPRLVSAIQAAREHGVNVELTVVSRPGQEPPEPRPAWMHLERAEGEAIHALLPDVLATVIPRPRSAYNDLALPIKLFDYLSYGRPLLVTDCTEQAKIVTDAGCGIVSTDDTDALARALADLVAAPPEQIDRWSTNAAAAARESSWGVRARAILDVLREEAT